MPETPVGLLDDDDDDRAACEDLPSIAPAPWRAIEEAPRDGTLVDLWVATFGYSGAILERCRWSAKCEPADWVRDGMSERAVSPFYHAAFWLPAGTAASDDNIDLAARPYLDAFGDPASWPLPMLHRALTFDLDPIVRENVLDEIRHREAEPPTEAS